MTRKSIYLCIICSLYMVIALVNIALLKNADIADYAPLLFVMALALPLVVPPFGKWLGLDI